MADESELVRESQGGNREAYGRLYARHAERVKSLLRRVTGDAEVANDLSAEAFLEGFLGIAKLRDSGAFASWMCAIALNLSKRHLARQAAGERAQHLSHGGREVDNEARTLDPQLIAEQRELNEWVLRAVNDLPEGLRGPTVLFYYENLSTREIAAILKLNVGAVKTRLSRSRSQLRQTIVNRYNHDYFANYSKRRVRSMVKVEVLGVFPAEQQSSQFVLLLDRAVPRVLFMLIGEAEGHAMALNSRGVQLPRPMTYQVIPQLIQAAGGEIESVRVEALRGTTFFAIIAVKGLDGIKEVDARPSDAINIALCARLPIHVNDSVMDRCSVEIPFASDTVFRAHGIEQIREQFRARASKPRPKVDKDVIRKLERAVLEHVNTLTAD